MQTATVYGKLTLQSDVHLGDWAAYLGDVKACSGLMVNAGHMTTPPPQPGGLNLPQFVVDFSAPATGIIYTHQCSYTLQVTPGKAFTMAVAIPFSYPYQTCSLPGCASPRKLSIEAGNALEEDLTLKFECHE